MDAYPQELAKLLVRFGENVRRARLSRQPPWSQERLADQCRLHRTAIARIERGAVEPRLTTLMVLADGLGVTTDQLLEGVLVPNERRPSPTGSGSPLV